MTTKLKKFIADKALDIYELFVIVSDDAEFFQEEFNNSVFWNVEDAEEAISMLDKKNGKHQFVCTLGDFYMMLICEDFGEEVEETSEEELNKHQS